jgi:hypothetical protein
VYKILFDLFHPVQGARVTGTAGHSTEARRARSAGR